MSSDRIHIGVDLDNTIIRYDHLFTARAVAGGLIPSGAATTKDAIRNHLRSLPGGEARWTRLQGEVYGKYLHGADLFPGVDRFLRRCRRKGIPVSIISHKTEYPALGDRVNLRDAALAWMETHRFFTPDGFDLPEKRLFFESTKEEKLERIARSGCTHFIDDLAEIFTDARFPPSVAKILFLPHEDNGAPKGVRVCRSWDEITAFFFPR